MMKCLWVIAFLALSTFAQDIPKSKGKWLTLKGEEPLIIARGGFSGLFPESSLYANQIAQTTSLHTTVLFCNIQFTKDGVAICLSDIRLQNSTNIQEIFPKARQSYKINGNLITGWFSIDYTSEILFTKLNLVQSALSRPSIFDTELTIAALDDIIGLKSQVWVNAQNEAFYQQHNQSVTAFLQKAITSFRLSFVSSSEIGILKSLSEDQSVKNSRTTKLVFQFLEETVTEPTTGKTYGELVKDLSMIKTFASGILIRKEYIWPIGPDGYVLPATTLVADAHKLGIHVYASGFANDAIAGYNYSYDPIREYLQFIDNANFAVDGFLSDFPITASQAIACYSSIHGTVPLEKGDALVISSNGASGDYPGSTDLAYQGAIDDGADVIDCSVQLSKDGVPFCMEFPDLMPSTTVITTFSDKTRSIPEIQREPGIFSFDLTWSEILTIKPQTISPYLTSSRLGRNPAFKNKGKFMTLPEFLDLAKSKEVAGIMINIQNAAYIASKQGLDMLGTISTALTNASFDKQSSTQKVFIRSDDTSVLSIFKTKFPTLTRVLTLDGTFGSVPKAAIDKIKNYAEVVAIPRSSIIDTSNFLTTNSTPVIADLKAANISVFAYVMRNEFVSLAFDFYSQASMEISTYVDYFHVDGIITEFPYTAKKFLTCPCRPNNPNLDPNHGFPILPIEAGMLLSMVEKPPPINPPMSPMNASTIVDPPLPPVSNVSSSTATAADGPADAPPSAGAVSNVASWLLPLLSVVVLTFLSHSAL